MSAVQTKIVAADEAGVRLDRWFRRHFPDLAHGRLEKLLRTGQVRVDGRRVKAGERLAEGQTVRVPPLPAEPDPALAALQPAEGRRAPPAVPSISRADAEALQAAVLHRDAEVLVLNKPAGLAVQGGTDTDRHLDGLLDCLRFGSEERPRLVHRLDKDTSGVLVLARSGAVAARLAEAFRSRAAIKIYWAVTVGVPQPLQGEIDAPLAKKAGVRGERMAKDDEDGLAAVTRYLVAETAGRRAASVVLRPLTGRTHQLRVHLAELATPILGDGKYGGSGAFLPGADLPRMLHLHARRLILPHPRGNGRLDVTAPLPPHMGETWSWLGFTEDMAAAATLVVADSD